MKVKYEQLIGYIKGYIQLGMSPDITPAKPKRTKKTSKISKPQTKQPNPPLNPPPPPSAFSTRQLQASNNRRSAAVLFTPHRQHTGIFQHDAHLQQSSPTLRLGSHSLHQLRTILSQLSSEGEDVIEVGLQRLNLGSRLTSDTSLDSQSGIGQHSGISGDPQAGTGQHSGPHHHHTTGSSQSHSQSDSNSHSHHSQPPHAGLHSKSKNPPRPRGGAKDFWTFC